MANVHLSGSRAKSAFRKAAAGLLAASLLLPAVGCKRSVKNKNETRYASGKKISETDPYFDAKVSPVKFPERTGSPETTTLIISSMPVKEAESFTIFLLR